MFLEQFLECLFFLFLYRLRLQQRATGGMTPSIGSHSTRPRPALKRTENRSCWLFTKGDSWLFRFLGFFNEKKKRETLMLLNLVGVVPVNLWSRNLLLTLKLKNILQASIWYTFFYTPFSVLFFCICALFCACFENKMVLFCTYVFSDFKTSICFAYFSKNESLDMKKV